jgi:hypothetical protein
VTFSPRIVMIIDFWHPDMSEASTFESPARCPALKCFPRCLPSNVFLDVCAQMFSSMFVLKCFPRCLCVCSQQLSFLALCATSFTSSRIIRRSASLPWGETSHVCARNAPCFIVSFQPSMLPVGTHSFPPLNLNSILPSFQIQRTEARQGYGDQ